MHGLTLALTLPTTTLHSGISSRRVPRTMTKPASPPYQHTISSRCLNDGG